MTNEVIPLVATIDVGTTSTRVILFDKYGREVAKHQIEYSTSAQSESKLDGQRKNSTTEENIFSLQGIAIKESDNLEIEIESVHPTLVFPRPGWVECDPIHILVNTVQCLGFCVEKLLVINENNPNNDTYKISSIGIANMRETTIVWSKATGKPLHNGIVWNDTRTINIVNDIKENNSEEVLNKIRDLSGCPISTYFSALKWKWLYENIPEIKDKYDNSNDLMFGTVDTWLLYNLTKEKSFVTDITNASRTSFMNLETRDYDPYLLDFWKVDTNKLNLPKILPSSYNYGTFQVNQKFLNQFSNSNKLQTSSMDLINEVLSGITINGVLGDQSASLVGQLAVKEGDAKCTYGTGCFLLYNLGNKKLISNYGAVTTVGYWFPDLDENEDGTKSNEPQYCLEGSIAVAGSIVQWLRDNLKLINKASDIGPLASQVPNAAGVVFVPAFSGLFAPYWDSDTTGTIFGLTQYTSASHIARAAIEGVCFQVRAILKSMISDTGSSTEFLEDRKKLQKAVNGIPHKQPLSKLVVDGGMSNSNTVMQIQADILGPCVSVIRSPNAECTALGVAIAAGLHKDIKFWSSLNEATELISKASIENLEDPSSNKFKAKMSDKKRHKYWTLWERAVERAKGWRKKLNDDEHEFDSDVDELDEEIEDGYYNSNSD